MREETKKTVVATLFFLKGSRCFLPGNSRPMIFRPYFLSWRISIIPPVSCFDLRPWLAGEPRCWIGLPKLLPTETKSVSFCSWSKKIVEEDLRWLVGWRLLKQPFARCLSFINTFIHTTRNVLLIPLANFVPYVSGKKKWCHTLHLKKKQNSVCFWK